jgi:nucleoid DNA-binding protein
MFGILSHREGAEMDARRFMLTAVTKQQLIEQVAGATGQSKTDIERVYGAIVEQVSSALAAGEKVEMRGLGIFEAKQTKARTGRNPSTGASIEIPAGRKATFRPSKELKDRVAGTKREAAAAEQSADG